MNGDSVTVSPVLDKTFAAKLRRAATKVEEGTAERNRLIIEASEVHHAPLREIAEHAGITHVAVLKIIRKAG